MATTGGLMVLRKLLAAAWTKFTGKNPPTDLTDPKVTLPEALAWGVATGSGARDGALRHRPRHDAQAGAGIQHRS